MTNVENQAPAEGDAPFAWATFDGEGGFDLCLYDGNESHRDDYIKRNGPQFMSWVTPLYASKVQPKGTADLERQLDEVLKERDAASDYIDALLDEVLKERDAASDYIDALLDEVLGTDRHEWTSNYGHADAMEEVRERMSTLLQPMVDRAWNRFESAIQAPAPGARDAALEEAAALCEMWNNAAGYVEFGSTQAVEALVRQVLRDLPTQAPPGFVLVESPITEEMHQAACKVLLRASGLDGEQAYFCSPRNSTTDGVVPLADADAFADQVLAEPPA